MARVDRSWFLGLGVAALFAVGCSTPRPRPGGRLGAPGSGSSPRPEGHSGTGPRGACAAVVLGSAPGSLAARFGTGRCAPTDVHRLRCLVGRAPAAVSAFWEAAAAHPAGCLGLLGPDWSAVQLRALALTAPGPVRRDPGRRFLALAARSAAVAAARAKGARGRVLDVLERTLRGALGRSLRARTAPAAFVATVAGRPYVILAPWTGGRPADIRGFADETGTVGLLAAPRWSRPLSLGGVLLLDGRGRATRCSLGGPVLLSLLVPHFGDNPWAPPPDGDAARGPVSAQQRAAFWKRGRRWIALPAVDCRDRLTAPLLAEPADLSAGARQAPGRPHPLSPKDRALLLGGTKRAAAPEPALARKPVGHVTTTAWAAASDRVLALVSMAWGDWPACGQVGYGVSALWIRQRGRWRLVRLWRDLSDPIRLLWASDLDGDGWIELVLEKDPSYRERVLYRLRTRGTGFQLEAIRSYDIAYEDCPC